MQTERKSPAVERSSSVAGADSLLPIVSSQRERFRQRNVELEAVSRHFRPLEKVSVCVCMYGGGGG